jgi:hypothetical protein
MQTWLSTWSGEAFVPAEEQVPFQADWADPRNWNLFEPDKIGMHLKAGILPLATGNGVHVLAVAPDADADGRRVRAAAEARGIHVVQASRAQLASIVEAKSRDGLTRDAGQGLFERNRMNSALLGILPLQYAVVATLALTVLLALAIAPAVTLMALVGMLIAILCALVVFRFACMHAGTGRDMLQIDESMLAELDGPDLPTYTIMVPMLRERESTLRGLIHSLGKIDYPTSRLQIQLILEETDLETRNAIDALPLPEHFRVILIPHGEPHTKGKACNYGLHFASGEYFTIYDAEDHPDPLQLKKAVASFRRSQPDVVCAQAHLSFYNIRENWLTRMFTLDYTAWYDLMLPGLERLNVPICLGGTSNHFKTAIVRELDGWDAYNVTEDADMGLRFAKSGYRTIMLDSRTLEEANTRIGNWIRQRSRWMKGYMLTYLVHMRRPLALLRQIGAWRFLGVQLFVGGNFVGNLINPPLWALTMLWASNKLSPWTTLELFPPQFWYPAVFVLVIGNGAALGFTCLAARRRGLFDLQPYVLTLPLYWVLAAIATYKALYQLFTRPFYWEKTDHGLTQMTPSLVHCYASQRLSISKKDIDETLSV